MCECSCLAPVLLVILVLKIGLRQHLGDSMGTAIGLTELLAGRK